MESNNLKALVKIGGGVYETASGILALTGHGLAAMLFRRLHMPHQATMRYAQRSIREGIKMVEEGMNEIKL